MILEVTAFFKVARAAMTQAAETLAIKVPKGTHFSQPDFPRPRPFNRAKNHLIQTPNGPTRQANHNWDSLLPLLNSLASSAIHMLHRAARISSNANETVICHGDTGGETLFVAIGSIPSSAIGTTIPLSAAFSTEKNSLPLPLQSALSPISPASDTDSVPSSLSGCGGIENDKLRELLRREWELLERENLLQFQSARWDDNDPIRMMQVVAL
nr:hypothetical protein Iba_chr15dCG5320 [Ipomoea batatas]